MTADNLGESTVFDQARFQRASLSRYSSSSPASTCTKTSVSSFGSEAVQQQPDKRRSFKRIISKFGGSKKTKDDSQVEVDGQATRAPRTFGLKALLKGLTFTDDEMQLLRMDKRELEAMKCFGMDRETYRTAQANEMRYNHEDWAALHDILAFDLQLVPSARKQRSVTIKGKTRDRHGWWTMTMSVDDSVRINPSDAHNSPSDGASIFLSIWCCGVDQCSKQVQGMAACANCVIEAAQWLLANPLQVPNNADTMCELLHRGAATWRTMCADADLLARFPDGMFEFDTALQHHNAALISSQDDVPSWCAHSLRVCRERSLVGFFRPPGSCNALDSLLEGSLCDTMLWESMANAAPAVYAIAWNNHFLCARFEAPEQGGRVYLIDSLGRTLHSLCSSAFILRFADGAEQPRGHSRSGSQEGISTTSSTSSLCEEEAGRGGISAWRACALFFRNVYAGGVMTRLRSHLDQLSTRQLDETLPQVLQKLQIDVYCLSIAA